MVYTKVNVIHGIEIDRTQLLDFVEYVDVVRNIKKRTNISFDMEDENYYDLIVNNLLKKKMDRVKLFSYRCCSEIRDKKFIIGNSVHEYNRIRVKCDKCDEYTVCETCIGHTSNGYYDVEKIMDEIVVVNDSHVCQYCFNDNKKDIINNDCKFCDVKHFVNNNIKKIKSRNLDILHNWQNKNNFVKKYYLMIDDCLSCT